MGKLRNSQQMLEEKNRRLFEWIAEHAGKIEKLGIQFGLTREESLDVTVNSFRIIQKNIESIDESIEVNELYQIAIDQMLNLPGSNAIHEEIFPFKEDEELHSDILQLDKKIRIAFILYSFHGLEIEQIASILHITTELIESDLQAAKLSLPYENLKQRLNLLNKSYERLPVQFNSEQLIVQSSSQVSEKKKMSKKTLWSVVAVFALLLGAFTLLSFLPKTIEHAASESVINELTEYYLEERAKRQELLQFTDERFGQLKFIQDADMKMYQMKNALGDPRKRAELELEVEEIIESIYLPSEMMEEADNHQLSMKEEESIAFFAIYRDKIKDLIDIYDRIIWDHREEIENFEADSPEQKAHMMMLTRSSFSDELQNVIGQMNHHSIQFCANAQTGDIKSCYYWSHLHEQLMNNLHPHLRAYFFMIIEPDSFGTARSYIHSYAIDFLLEAQYTLINVRKDDILYPLLEAEFVKYLTELIKGTHANPIFNERNIVKHEVQEMWQLLFQYDYADPLTYLIKPIAEEMTASGWTNSEHWDAFNRDKIIEALTLGREGVLEEAMYGKPPVVESQIMSWPNNDFLAVVEHLYHLFKLDYDKNIFKNLSPLYLVGVFDYANEVEDPETMYHLFHESAAYWFSETGAEFTLENYMKRWLKGFSFFEGATSVEFQGKHLYRAGSDFISSVDINGDISRAVGVIIDQEGVWHMQQAWHTPLPKYDTFPETEIGQLSHEVLENYYLNHLLNMESYELRWVPTIAIAGLYFYTAEIGDFDSQYKLLFQDENHPIDKDEFIRNAKNLEYTLDEYFTSVSFHGQDQDENGNWPGIATFTVNLENFPNEKPQKEFKMTWTWEGWRVQMNPME